MTQSSKNTSEPNVIEISASNVVAAVESGDLDFGDNTTNDLVPFGSFAVNFNHRT